MFDLFYEINKIKREMDKMFEDFFRSNRKETMKLPQKFSQPLSDVQENEKEVVVKIDMPGIDKKEIMITVRGNILDVKVEKKHETKVEKKNLYKYERSYSGFHRSLSLPADVESNEIKSEYKDGILKIVIPKAKKKEVKKLVIKG